METELKQKSMYTLIEKSIDLGDGRTIIIQTGKLAKQADGSVVVKMGKTMLLATVVAAKEANPTVDFMPLSVDYQEKFASVGRFPGGFLKREGKPSDNEVLVSRLVDRAMRPLFPDDFHAETYVTINLISGDKDELSDALAGLAASSAMAVSDIPFNGPMSEVRVARVNGEFVINPTNTQKHEADIDIIIGATLEHIMMVEGEMNEVSESEMLEAIKIGHEAIKKQCLVQIELAAEVGRTKKREYAPELHDEEFKKFVSEKIYEKMQSTAHTILPKSERRDAFDKIEKDFITEFIADDDKVKLALFKRYYYEIEKEVVRAMILNDGLRLDGRSCTDIRPIWSEVDCLPSAHGSAIFTRGETQSLTTVTLGTKLDEKIIDEALNQGRDKFLLHYNFPPFATGDARATRGVSRREIGHGNLAHRSLKRMMPSEDTNPYTIRIVSDILESNGSSSMATVCAGTLALMDSGLKIKRPVSGIAMGLITDKETGKFAVLSDILGDEDHLGDMDFKVAGTTNGITACQMDIKVKGLSYEIMEAALEQARVGRAHILNEMLKTLSESRADYKPHAPRIEKIIIPKEMIGALIGPGGKVIQEIQALTGTIIAIEEINGEGHVNVAAHNKKDIDAAMRRIRGIIEVPEIGKVYKGIVKSIVAFGAFVEILPGKEGLLHISEIDWRRLTTASEVLKEGEYVDVKLVDIDSKSGKFKLSRKVLIPRPVENRTHYAPTKFPPQQ